MGLTTKPLRDQLPGESLYDYARYLYRADRHGAGMSVENIARRLGVDPTSIRRQVDPVFKWDQNRAARDKRRRRTPEERRLDALAGTVNKQRKREMA